MTNSVLLDSSFLIASYDLSDKHHERAADLADNFGGLSVLPQVVLSEVTFMLEEHVSEAAMLSFWQWCSLDNPAVQLESVSRADLRRAREIRLQYSDAHFDFVDCCIMALSERLNIAQICTFDRRDFSIFRPSHTDYLELLP